ncbi:MAG TPA: PAS domain-containing protein, partial [Chloroflexota bacterium]|nr:PAS domain-containing protein [Chloroflexota bacterium]
MKEPEVRRRESGRTAVGQVFDGDLGPSATALIEGSPVAIVSVDCFGAIAGWNATAERLLGWTPADVRGRQLSSVLEPEDEGLSRLAEVAQSAHLNGAEMRLR